MNSFHSICIHGLHVHFNNVFLPKLLILTTKVVQINAIRAESNLKKKYLDEIVEMLTNLRRLI